MANWLRKLLGYTIIAASIGAGWAWAKYELYLDTPLYVGDRVIYYTVDAGSSVKRIARELSEARVIRQPRFFEWFARLEGQAHRIHSGEYEILGSMTPRDLLADMVSGNVVQYPMTIVEGWSFKQLRSFLAQHDALEHTITDLSDAEVMAKIGYADEHAEGRFLPDTYHFPRGTKDTEFLKRAYLAMSEVLAEQWQGRDNGLPVKSPYEALILASIIEKETAVPAERPEIAGVFVRRLQKKMRLQTDPTVIYGMGEQYKGNIRRKDLRTDTPYNTYTRHGLPPTPIAMPSAAAIQAALQPKPGKTLYFVSKGNGEHYFSTTLAEHNQAVVKYQLNGRKRPFSSNP